MIDFFRGERRGFFHLSRNESKVEQANTSLSDTNAVLRLILSSTENEK